MGDPEDGLGLAALLLNMTGTVLLQALSAALLSVPVALDTGDGTAIKPALMRRGGRPGAGRGASHGTLTAIKPAPKRQSTPNGGNRKTKKMLHRRFFVTCGAAFSLGAGENIAY